MRSVVEQKLNSRLKYVDKSKKKTCGIMRIMSTKCNYSASAEMAMIWRFHDDAAQMIVQIDDENDVDNLCR